MSTCRDIKFPCGRIQLECNFLERLSGGRMGFNWSLSHRDELNSQRLLKGKFLGVCKVFMLTKAQI